MLQSFSSEISRARLPYAASYLSQPDRQFENTVLREVWFFPPLLCFRSLEYVLRRTDEELEEAAGLCGAKVIPHEWGLTSGANPFYSPRQVPRHSQLVASVDYIHVSPDEPPTEVVDRLNDGVSDYNAKRSRYKLSDQFAYGVNANDAGEANSPQLYLLDIEPKYRTKTIRLPY